jgi:hypothetical protein
LAANQTLKIIANACYKYKVTSKIRHSGMDSFYVFADVEHDAGKKVKNKREAYGKERRINKK